jgi:hypothetical protein
MPEASMTAADDTPQWRAQQTNPLAIASMVCGMVALVLGPLAILAIVFSAISPAGRSTGPERAAAA